MQILGSPSRYYQGAGILERMGDILKPLANRFFVFADQTVLPIVRNRIIKSFEASRLTAVFEIFRGECSYPEVFRLKAKAEEADAQVIVGMGGGKAIDAAKALSVKLDFPVVIVPTIAASDAPCTHVAVMYDENHVKLEVLPMRLGVSFVLVDTGIVAQAPGRFLSAGMGDALSKKFEAEACRKSGASNLYGGRPSQTALGLGELAYTIVKKHGEEAKISADRKEVTPALEKVVEANILLSGLAGENGGLAAAHAVYTGFTLIEEMRQSLHGELVAFGILVQLTLENRGRDFINDLIDFYRRIGLPASLGDLRLREGSIKKIERAVKKICEAGSYVHNMPFRVDERMVVEAIFEADSLSKDRKA